MKSIVLLTLLPLMLFAPRPADAMVINGDFEDYYLGPWNNGFVGPLPTGWDYRAQGSTNGTNTASLQCLEGRCINLFASTAGDHFVGDYIEFYQAVDVSLIETLYVDVRNSDAPGHSHDFTQSYVEVDGTKIWSEADAGNFLDVEIDLSGLTGIHEIALGVEVITAFPGGDADGHTYFDRLSTVMTPEPAPLALAAAALALGALVRRRRSQGTAA